MEVNVEILLTFNADIKRTQICNPKEIVEKVKNFVRGTEMECVARRGA